eukprot:m51a1_g14000 hypothetical protein (125) ;mRNA; r:1065366-1065740
MSTAQFTCRAEQFEYVICKFIVFVDSLVHEEPSKALVKTLAELPTSALVLQMLHAIETNCAILDEVVCTRRLEGIRKALVKEISHSMTGVMKEMWDLMDCACADIELGERFLRYITVVLKLLED